MKTKIKRDTNEDKEEGETNGDKEEGKNY